MDNIEMIEKLMEKADVTYEEAKGVLESTGWNLLNALIALEKEGKIKENKNTSYTTKAETVEDIKIENNESGKVKNTLKNLFMFIKKMVVKGLDNNLCVTRKDGKEFKIQLTILALITFIAFEVVLVAFVITFFCGYTYNLEGPDVESENINRIMNKIQFNSCKDNNSDKYNVDDKK